MTAFGRLVVVALLALLLPLRGVLAVDLLGCGGRLDAPPAPASAAHDHAGHHDPAAQDGDHHASPCKVCAPCCLTAAPPPAPAVEAAPAAPSARAAPAGEAPWHSIVPALPDPPPRR